MAFRAVSLVLCLLWGWAAGAGAQESPSFSAQIMEEGGVFQFPYSVPASYQLSQVQAQVHGDLDTEWSWAFAGEAAQQSSPLSEQPLWITPAASNLVNLEADDSSPALNTAAAMARLNRAFLKWTSGPWDITAGLQGFSGGTAYFYQPTRYFNPVPAMAWLGPDPLGSEGLLVNRFLFDDLSLEGAVRWLSGGAEEWTVRVLDKGIGLSVVPSFAHLQGRDGAGLELSGTFPDFQARIEGVDWFDDGNAPQLEWIAGLSTLVQGTQWTLEGLRDTTGEALGEWASGNPGDFYFFASAQRVFSGQWRAEPAFVKSVDGGALWLWPQLAWTPAPDWKLAFQAQWPLGAASGALGLYPSRSGLSLNYLF